jgi:hypothetical protein
MRGRKKATKAFELGRYQRTIDFYKKRLASNPNDGVANFYVAESYRLSNRIKEAVHYYQKAGGKGIDSDSVKFFTPNPWKPMAGMMKPVSNWNTW